MPTTFTFRLSPQQRRKLSQRATAIGKTESGLLREMIDRELDDKPLVMRAGHTKGSLSLGKARLTGWRKQIRERNWRR